jgi:hypothetical protein
VLNTPPIKHPSWYLDGPKAAVSFLHEGFAYDRPLASFGSSSLVSFRPRTSHDLAREIEESW